MEELGIGLPFNPMVREITEMVDFSVLFVSQMFHKSYIVVNEEWTKAAACTAAITIPYCASYQVASFVADCPFMFMTREETSNIVFFVGAELNPLMES
ncbi:hypothetical protein Patl1_21609 [Pistacia atlantica]|uniref:Uncharacterized protein n=1 Tax=Pistacia atlantica TaxID=434234 RepID=A0ACC1BLA4_9ROSI|nr:hypothetical protein Patl1_21609 [Pistacia atlantica]